MQEQIITHYLDMNRQYELRMSFVPKAGSECDAKVELICPPDIKSELKKNLTDLLRISRKGGRTIKFNEDDGRIVGSETLDLRDSTDLSITINKQVVGGYHVTGGQLQPIANNENYALTASSLRMMSFPWTEKQKNTLPYPTDDLGQLDESCLPKTDLHTHLSSQLSGETMMRMAIAASVRLEKQAQEEGKTYKEKLAYPVELLDELGIDYSGLDATHDIDPYKFNPALDKKKAKSCEMFDPADWKKIQSGDSGAPDIPEEFEAPKLKGVKLLDLWGRDEENPSQPAKKPSLDCQKLIRAFSIPQDQVYGPNDFDETFYRFRNPLEKNEILAEDKIMEVARIYKEQGIEYAELSTGAMLKPEWLEEAIPAIEKAEKQYGVKLRLLVGIPRTSSPEKVAATIENIKFLGQCPYIVGADFLGFESNPTEDFNWALYNLARWSRRLKNNIQESDEFSNYTDEFVLRVHAGENNENVDNVADALAIAKHFGVPMRIGHAVHSYIDDKLAAIARQAEVIFEFIPASNIALNNVTYLHEIPIAKWLEKGVQCVLGSDGEGAYQTNNRQLATDAHFAGVSIDRLKDMRFKEDNYIGDREAVFRNKQTAFNDNYKPDLSIEGDTAFNAFVRAYEQYSGKVKPNKIPARFEGKVPILIAGASGESWQQIDPKHREQISTSMRMMVEMLDPEKVYFATGRVKDRGIEKELDYAIDDYDSEHWRKERPFDMMATYAMKGSDTKIANGVTWINAVNKEPDAIAPDVIDFMIDNAAETHNGHAGAYALFAGGKVLTSEFIRFAREKGLVHGLMEGPQGRAHDEVARAHSESVIKNGGKIPLAEATLRHLVDNLGTDIFKEQYREKMNNKGAIKEMIHLAYEEEHKAWKTAHSERRKARTTERENTKVEDTRTDAEVYDDLEAEMGMTVGEMQEAFASPKTEVEVTTAGIDGIAGKFHAARAKGRED